MRSLWLLNELELDYELVTMEFSMAALRTPEYLSVSPLGRVPCLQDDELTIFESGEEAGGNCRTLRQGDFRVGRQLSVSLRTLRFRSTVSPAWRS